MINPKGKYIFGIVPSSSRINKKTGDSGEMQVHVVKSGKFSAIVAEAEIVDYKNSSRESLAHLLVYHQQVLEKIMADGHTVIPLKLGTVVKDENEVCSVLDRGGTLLKNIMKKIDGKVEIDLLAVWNDFPSVLKKIGEEKEMLDFKQKLLAQSDPITENDQRQAGIMVKQSLNRKKDQYAQKINEKLHLFGDLVRVHEAINDEIVFNTSFLIDNDRQKYFDEQVKVVNDELGDELNFRTVGPLPCYSFYTLEVERIDFCQLDHARKVLELSVSASRDDIKTAYKNKALDVHPDRQKKTENVGNFNTVNQAFKTVMTYCAATDLNPSPPHYYSFRQEDVDNNLIIVKLRG